MRRRHLLDLEDLYPRWCCADDDGGDDDGGGGGGGGGDDDGGGGKADGGATGKDDGAPDGGGDGKTDGGPDGGPGTGGKDDGGPADGGGDPGTAGDTGGKDTAPADDGGPDAGAQPGASSDGDPGTTSGPDTTATTTATTDSAGTPLGSDVTSALDTANTGQDLATVTGGPAAAATAAGLPGGTVGAQDEISGQTPVAQALDAGGTQYASLTPAGQAFGDQGLVGDLIALGKQSPNNPANDTTTNTWSGFGIGPVGNNPADTVANDIGQMQNPNQGVFGAQPGGDYTGPMSWDDINTALTPGPQGAQTTIDPASFFDPAFDPNGIYGPSPSSTPPASSPGPGGSLISSPAAAATLGPDAITAINNAVAQGQFDAAPSPANLGITTGPMTGPGNTNTVTDSNLPAWTGTVDLGGPANQVPSTADLGGPPVTAGLGGVNAPAFGAGDLGTGVTTTATTADQLAPGKTDQLTVAGAPTAQDRINAVAAQGGFNDPATTTVSVNTPSGQVFAGGTPNPMDTGSPSAPPNTTNDTTVTPTASPATAPSGGPGITTASDVTTALATAGTPDGNADGGVTPTGPQDLITPIPPVPAPVPPSDGGGGTPLPGPLIPPIDLFGGNVNPDEGLFGNVGLPGGPVPPNLALPGGINPLIAVDPGGPKNLGPPPVDGGNFNPNQGLFDILNNAVDTLPPAGNFNPNQGIS